MCDIKEIDDANTKAMFNNADKETALGSTALFYKVYGIWVCNKEVDDLNSNGKVAHSVYSDASPAPT